MQVLAVWAAASLTTFIILRLGAQDTPATPWAGAAPGWAQHMAFWDAGWYERISREGYPATLPVDGDGRVSQNSWAFMPLLPLLAGVLGWTGWSFHACAAAVSVAASAGAAIVADRWLAPRTGPTASLWAVGLVWSSPCAAILQVPYAESLGLLLVGLALLRLSRGRALSAIPFAVLASFARPVGVPLGAALGLWWAWETAHARGLVPRHWYRRLLPAQEPLVARSRLHLLVAALTTCAAALAWPAIAWAVTGRADAYTATETSWRGDHLVPFTPWLIRAGWWVGDHLGWALVLVALLAAALILSARASRLLGAPAWFWCAGYIVYLLAFFDPTTSLIRLLLPLAPLAWGAASVLGARGRLALLASCLGGQLWWVAWVWDLGTVHIQWVP
ncbi:hypothetical protein EII10_08995 [Actinomyces bowdenii]|uniref:Integral membrane protein n=1 Tax=Actinomyces bowdenii TaxID=131109 RepID=A0A3P1V371_9ACTO|nr:hypothetical protein EII10_08995 [Actinomyces bowdenii]